MTPHSAFTLCTEVVATAARTMITTTTMTITTIKQRRRWRQQQQQKQQHRIYCKTGILGTPENAFIMFL
jgi:hypothetical protein